jgi:hypothetical protein
LIMTRIAGMYTATTLVLGTAIATFSLIMAIANLLMSRSFFGISGRGKHCEMTAFQGECKMS